MKIRNHPDPGPRRSLRDLRRLLPASIAVLLVLATEQLVEHFASAAEREAERVHSLDALAVVRAALQGQVLAHQLLVHGLTAVIADRPEIDQAGFEHIARGLVDERHALRNLTAAPDMVISLIYPLSGNEAALGLDYRQQAEQRAAALRVKETGQPLLAGPVRLVQGGDGFVLREPVFLPAAAPGRPRRFWGLVSAVIDRDGLYAAAGLPADGLRLALRGRDASGAGGPIFYGDARVFAEQPVSRTVQVPGGEWLLAAVPQGGWGRTGTALWQIRLLGLLAAGVAAVLVHLRSRAAEASRTNALVLDSVFQALPDLFFLLGADGTIRDYRAQRAGDLYVPAERFLGKRMQDVLPTGVGERFTAEIDALLASDNSPPRGFEYVLPMSEGERHFEARLGRLPGRPEVVAVVQDVEDRYQSSLTLRKWADAFEHCARGIALGDARSNRFLACNPAFEALLGEAPDALVGRPILDIYAPSSHTHVKQQIGQVDVLGAVRYEAELRHRDGTLIPVEVDLVSIRGLDGRPLYRVATVQDIRERRVAVAALEQAREDLRLFAQKLDRDIERERRRLAREVHDQLGQVFTALKLKLLGCQAGTAIEPSVLGEFDRLLDGGIQVARRIAADLRPAMLDDLGLGPALEHYARELGRRTGLAVEAGVASDPRLGPIQTTQYFRIAQEALTNVIRHAGASRVRLRGLTQDGHYVMRLEDDGRGMDPAGAEGLGLLGMRERAELIGGRLVLGRSGLGGLSVTLSVPLIEEDE